MTKTAKIKYLKLSKVFLVAEKFIQEGEKIISEYKKVEDEDNFSTIYSKELAWFETIEGFLKENMTKEDFKKFKKNCKEEGIWVKADENPIKDDIKIRIHNLNRKINALKDLARKTIIDENVL